MLVMTTGNSADAADDGDADDNNGTRIEYSKECELICIPISQDPIACIKMRALTNTPT